MKQGGAKREEEESRGEGKRETGREKERKGLDFASLAKISAGSIKEHKFRLLCLIFFSQDMGCHCQHNIALSK